MSTRVSLRIHSVKCIDETGTWLQERVGGDEIATGAIGITAGANAVKAGPVFIDDNFDDGDIVRFSPPKTLINLSLTDAPTFPKTCHALVLLAEKDVGGGFSGKLNGIFNKVKEELAKKKAAMAPAGAGVATLAPTGAQLGLIWGIIKPLVLPWIKNLLRAIVNDDIFAPTDVTVKVSSNDALSTGGRVSPQFPVEFRGHNGAYQMTCDWELS